MDDGDDSESEYDLEGEDSGSDEGESDDDEYVMVEEEEEEEEEQMVVEDEGDEMHHDGEMAVEGAAVDVVDGGDGGGYEGDGDGEEAGADDDSESEEVEELYEMTEELKMETMGGRRITATNIRYALQRFDRSRWGLSNIYGDPEVMIKYSKSHESLYYKHFVPHWIRPVYR